MLAALVVGVRGANAWERWLLDWVDPQDVTRSGEYVLQDYATQADAIRIQLPGLEEYMAQFHQYLED